MATYTVRNLTRDDFHGILSDNPTLEEFHNFFINQAPSNWMPQDTYYLYNADLCIGNKGGDGDGYWKNIEPVYINGDYYMPMGKIIMIKFVDNQWVKYHPLNSNNEIIYERYTPDSLIKRKKGFFEKLINGE